MSATQEPTQQQQPAAAPQEQPASTEPAPAATEEAAAPPPPPPPREPGAREKKMIAFRDDLKAKKDARLAAQSERRENLAKQREKLYDDQKTSGERRVDVEDNTVQERRDIEDMDAAIDRAAAIFARLELLRKHDAARSDWLAKHKASEGNRLEEAERKQQAATAEAVQDALDAVTSRRAEIKAVIDLFNFNDAIIKGEMGKLPGRESSGWQDWAYLTETETQVAEAAAAGGQSPGTSANRSQTATTTLADRNAIVPVDSLEHKRRIELEDKLDELRGKEADLSHRKRVIGVELKTIERDITGTESKLRDQLRTFTHQKRDAQRRTQEVIRLNEYILHSCVEDQRQLQKITGVAVPGSGASTSPASRKAQRPAVQNGPSETKA